MMRNTLKLLALLVLSWFLQGCQSDFLKESGWSPSVLSPLATTTLDFRDLSSLNGLEGTYTLPADQLNIPDFGYNQPIDVPPIGPFNLPTAYLRLSQVVRSLSVSKAEVNISITNIFPIPIGAGTEIACRDSASGRLIFSYTLTEEVVPGATIEFPLNLIDEEIPAVMTFGMENFRSAGGSGVQFSSQPMEVHAVIKVLELNRAELRNNLDIELKELESDFSLNLDQIQDTAALSGSLNLFIEHRFPARVELKVSFLNDSNDEVFSLFSQEEENTLVLEAAPVDANGQVTSALKKDMIGFIHLKSDLNQLALASKIRVYARLSTPAAPATLVVDSNSQIVLSLSGKLSLETSHLGE